MNDKSKDDVKPVYDIYADEDKILEVRLNGEQKQNRIGLLTYNVWKTEKIELKAEKGLHTCNILAPNNYKVYVNNKELTEDFVKDLHEVLVDGLCEGGLYRNVNIQVKANIYRQAGGSVCLMNPIWSTMENK